MFKVHAAHHPHLPIPEKPTNFGQNFRVQNIAQNGPKNQHILHVCRMPPHPTLSSQRGVGLTNLATTAYVSLRHGRRNPHSLLLVCTSHDATKGAGQ